MGSAVRTLAGVACGVLVAGLLMTGTLAWRLSRGPIRLDFVTPRLEAALRAPDGSTTVDIGSTTFEWDPRDRDLDVRVRDLRVLGPGGAPRATLPALTVDIAPGPLLFGAVRPRALEVIAPRIHVVRDQDGSVAVGLGHPPTQAGTQLLLGALDGGGRRGGAPALRLRDGEVVLDDRSSGTTWHATNVVLSARPEAQGLTIERLAFDLDPASIEATGRIRAGTATLDVDLRRLPTRVLERWWPERVAPALRRWVLANVSGGGVTTARATISGSIADRSVPRLTLGAMSGRVGFAGLDVRWRDGMPPFTDVGGTGTFSASGWQFRVARGDLEGLEVVRALLAPLPADGGGIRVDATVRSPLSKALALLALPGMQAAANFPFRPGEISGGATARILVRAPLDRADAEVTASGELRSVALRRAFRGRNVNARRLRFDLDGREFEMRGEITIGRAPLRLRWHEALAGAARGTRVITVKSRLDAEGRKAFGANLEPWLTGPIDVQARLTTGNAGATRMDVRTDLAPATIDLPLINMMKEPGAPGSSYARLLLSGGKVTAVDDFRLQAAGGAVVGRGVLDPDETWRSIDGTITVPPRSDGGSTGRLVVAVEQGGTGSQLSVTSDDAGGILRAVDTYADATGGRLKLTGTVRLGVPGTPFNGVLSIDRFVLKRSPMVAKIAALGSLGGVIELLASDGLPFSQLVVTFTQRAGAINIAEGVAASPGLALTVRGTVDRTRDDLSLEGTLVPNYDGLNRLVREVAVPAAVFTGFGGEAVPAFDFSVSGSLADPYVTAQPSTAIAPATLRDLKRLSTVPVDLTRGSTRRGKREVADADAESATGEGRTRKRAGRGSAKAASSKTGARTKTDAQAKPRVRRRAPVAPSELGTGTE
jgi:hypothetical protein